MENEKRKRNGTKASNRLVSWLVVCLFLLPLYYVTIYLMYSPIVVTFAVEKSTKNEETCALLTSFFLFFLLIFLLLTAFCGLTYVTYVKLYRIVSECESDLAIKRFVLLASFRLSLQQLALM